MARTSTWRDERRIIAALKAYGKPVKGSKIVREASVPGPHANAVLRHLFQERLIRPTDPHVLSSQKAQFQSVEWELV